MVLTFKRRELKVYIQTVFENKQRYGQNCYCFQITYRRNIYVHSLTYKQKKKTYYIIKTIIL